MRPVLIITVWLVGVLSAGACTDPPADAPPDAASGVRGVVVAGPQCPVVVQGSPCPDRPWRGTVRLTDSDGDLVAEVSTDAAGRFEAPAEPGTYVVTALPGPAGLGGARERTVRVPDGRWVEVRLTVDTGIR